MAVCVRERDSKIPTIVHGMVMHLFKVEVD